MSGVANSVLVSHYFTSVCNNELGIVWMVCAYATGIAVCKVTRQAFMLQAFVFCILYRGEMNPTFGAFSATNATLLFCLHALYFDMAL
jgi:hypothetical protein